MDKNTPILKTGNLIIGYDGKNKIPYEIVNYEGDKVTVLDIFTNEKTSYSISEFYGYFEQDVSAVKNVLSERIDQYKFAIYDESNNFVKNALQSTLRRLVNYANKAVKVEQLQNSVINCVCVKISEFSDREIIDLIMYLGLSNQLTSPIGKEDVFNRHDTMKDYLLFMDGVNKITLVDVSEKINLKKQGYKIKELTSRFDFFTQVNNLAPVQPKK